MMITSWVKKFMKSFMKLVADPHCLSMWIAWIEREPHSFGSLGFILLPKVN